MKDELGLGLALAKLNAGWLSGCDDTSYTSTSLGAE
jgi:hypothetical protein